LRPNFSARAAMRGRFSLPTQQSWYAINAAARGQTDILLYDEIGAFGISADKFVADLNGIDSRTINLHINSEGGEVFDGIAIYEGLKAHKATVNVVVDSIAASIASVIAQAGDSRVMAKRATMMIHDAQGLVVGPADDMRQMADTLDLISDQIAGIYADRAGGDAERWRSAMRDPAQQWMKADKAVEVGLADRIADVTNSATRQRIYNLSRFKDVPEWVKNDLQEPEIPEKAAPDTDHGWPYLAHHDESGAVDREALDVALRRVKDLRIPVSNREKALLHLNGHAKVAARAA
jgi:ATP-dependent protease ClpP protease subunit